MTASPPVESKPVLHPPEHNPRLESEGRDGLTECPACGALTPAENLNCIYCGEILPVSVGFLSSLLSGWKGRAGLGITIIILIAFLLWIF